MQRFPELALQILYRFLQHNLCLFSIEFVQQKHPKFWTLVFAQHQLPPSLFRLRQIARAAATVACNRERKEGKRDWREGEHGRRVQGLELIRCVCSLSVTLVFNVSRYLSVSPCVSVPLCLPLPLYLSIRHRYPLLASLMSMGVSLCFLYIHT